MNITQTSQPDAKATELLGKIRDYGVSFRLIETLTKTRGLNDGNGYSYDYIRKVLVYQNRSNSEIVELAEQVVKVREKYEQSKAA